MYSMRGADLLIQLLERQGIETICGVPGGAILPIYDALSRSKRIRHVLARHEQGAGFMAQGMARSTGKPAVFFATSGPGATNTLTPFADAKSDSVPLICITGQVSSTLLGTDAFQEVDIYGMTIPVAKHNFLIRSAQELLTVIPEAFRIAASGRPGPVLVDIPRDIQLALVEFEEWPEPGQPEALPGAPALNLERAMQAIQQANRPVILAGGGVIASNAVQQVRELAETLRIPVAMSLLGLGTLPPEHPLYLGLLGMHGARYSNMLLDECDLLLVAGARLDDRATGNAAQFCHNANIIHIDIDQSEQGKIRQSHIDIAGDVKEVFEYFLEQSTKNHSENTGLRNTEQQSSQPDQRALWLERIATLKDAYPLQTPESDNILSAYGIIKKVAEIVGDDAIVATDVGQHQMRTAQFYPLKHPRTWLSSGGLGTMGFGLPTAIGAALANPERTVVCFSGDGSLLMNIQELATAVEQNVNIKIILTNNNGLGLIHQIQDMFFEGRTFAWNYSNHIDFIRISEGFGLPALDLATSADPETALRDALTKPGPILIHLLLDVRDKIYPIVPPGSANTNMIGD